MSFRRIFTLGFALLDYKISTPSSHQGFAEGFPPSLGLSYHKGLKGLNKREYH